MLRKVASLAALALIALLGFAVAGCGGGGGNKSSEGTTAASTTEPATTEAAPTTTEAAPTTTESAPTTTAAPTTTSGSPGSFASAKNCRQFAEVASKLSQAFSGTGSTDLQKVAAYFDQLAKSAPEEVRGDFKVIADAFHKIADALKGVDLKNPSPDALAKLQKLQKEIDQVKLQAAEQHISAWAAKNCHA